MILLDGKSTSQKRLEALKAKIAAEKSRSGLIPGLVVIRVGSDAASEIYVKKKIKTCSDLGMHSLEDHQSADITEARLLEIIRTYNQDPRFHGILVQLPLPKHISEKVILDAVNPLKDVDGFHPVNLGKLVAREDGFVPCTPLGVMNLLLDYKIAIDGKRAVVVGRSRIVGRPASLLLDHAGATVTVVHLHTKNPRDITTQADILLVAVGKPNLITSDDVKSGATVIDVGINRLANGKIVGDVDFDRVKDKVHAITPVPGGVGPMTISTLLENTWKAFQNLSIDRR